MGPALPQPPPSLQILPSELILTLPWPRLLSMLCSLRCLLQSCTNASPADDPHISHLHSSSLPMIVQPTQKASHLPLNHRSSVRFGRP